VRRRELTSDDCERYSKRAPTEADAPMQKPQEEGDLSGLDSSRAHRISGGSPMQAVILPHALGSRTRQNDAATLWVEQQSPKLRHTTREILCETFCTRRQARCVEWRVPFFVAHC
jgi:hypothetical protein